MLNKELQDTYKKILSREELKFTPQRLAVLEEMVRDDGHRECEEIYMALKRKGKNVSRATVYRTIDILVKNNLARKLELGDGRARYENKVNIAHHDHLICTSCGKIVEFMDPKIEALQDTVASEHNFTLSRHIHQLFGRCYKCQ